MKKNYEHDRLGRFHVGSYTPSKRSLAAKGVETAATLSHGGHGTSAREALPWHVALLWLS